jgi:hypothetical protein
MGRIEGVRSFFLIDSHAGMQTIKAEVRESVGWATCLPILKKIIIATVLQINRFSDSNNSFNPIRCCQTK